MASPALPSRSSIPARPPRPPRAGRGQAAALSRPCRPSAVAAPEPVPESAPEPVPAPAGTRAPHGSRADLALPVAQRRPRLPRRGDRGLAETVGASPVGRSWDDLLAGPVEAEPALAEALAQRRTFRALPVRWRIAGTRTAVAVDLSGAPRLGAGRAFAGFSGFGVIHPERIVPAADRPEAAEPKPPRPSLRERAAAVIAVGRPQRRILLHCTIPLRCPPRTPSGLRVPAPAPDPDTPDLASLAGATMAEFAGLPDGGALRASRDELGFGTRPSPAPQGTSSAEAGDIATGSAGRSPSREPHPERSSSDEASPGMRLPRPPRHPRPTRPVRIPPSLRRTTNRPPPRPRRKRSRATPPSPSTSTRRSGRSPGRSARASPATRRAPIPRRCRPGAPHVAPARGAP